MTNETTTKGQAEMKVETKSVNGRQYTKFYRFTETAKALTYKQWKKTGGCSIPNAGMAFSAARDENETLDSIAKECPHSERSLARYGFNNLNENLTEPCWVFTSNKG